jgi:hypothetical protein
MIRFIPKNKNGGYGPSQPSDDKGWSLGSRSPPLKLGDYRSDRQKLSTVEFSDRAESRNKNHKIFGLVLLRVSSIKAAADVPCRDCAAQGHKNEMGWIWIYDSLVSYTWWTGGARHHC